MQNAHELGVLTHENLTGLRKLKPDGTKLLNYILKKQIQTKFFSLSTICKHFQNEDRYIISLYKAVFLVKPLDNFFE